MHSETNLLKSNAVGLWLAVLSQVELCVEGLGKRAMTALSKQCQSGMELHSSGKGGL